MIAVVAAALLTAAPAAGWAASGGTTPRTGSSPSSHAVSGRAARNPLAGRGMWIWQLPSSDHGNLGSIIAQAKRYGVGTLMIKSGDGSSVWSQFNRQLVARLHASGIRACAWQYVYGTHPLAEAQVGVSAIRNGADCLLIDAESQYEGKYVQAQAYIQKLRSLIGQNFPVALAGFPYVDFHPAFPYSVFLGPGGAQYNAPQMYWKDIGTSVDTVYAHTYSYNRVYGRPVFPLGQVFQSPPSRQITRFRQISRSYGSSGVSWWDWQEAPTGAWSAIAKPIGTLHGFTPYGYDATLSSGMHGDAVVLAQEHLVSAGRAITIDGGFGPQTRAAVAAFQTAHGLAPTGIIDTTTWQALLRYPPAQVKWVSRNHRLTANPAAAGVRAVPRSASLRSSRYEIPRSLGAGRPSNGRPSR